MKPSLRAYALNFLSLLLPWPLRRRWLAFWFGYQLDPGSHIGWSWVLPGALTMARGATIGHLTICKGLDFVALDEQARLGPLNWITGTPSADKRHYTAMAARRPSFVLGQHAAITGRHYFDCTDSIRIGAFATVSGARSQFWTHGIDINRGHQASAPISIGAYCMVGSGVVCLRGSEVPDRCVVAAGAVVAGRLPDSLKTYGGTPARPIGDVSPDAAYFHRTTGYIA